MSGCVDTTLKRQLRSLTKDGQPKVKAIHKAIAPFIIWFSLRAGSQLQYKLQVT